MTTHPLTLLHNPHCSTSVHALDALEAAGLDVTVRRYLLVAERLSPDELRSLAQRLKGDPPDALIRRDKKYATLGLDADGIGVDEVVAILTAHPELLQRPILDDGEAAMIGRPAVAPRPGPPPAASSDAAGLEPGGGAWGRNHSRLAIAGVCPTLVVAMLVSASIFDVLDGGAVLGAVESCWAQRPQHAPHSDTPHRRLAGGHRHGSRDVRGSHAPDPSRAPGRVGPRRDHHRHPGVGGHIRRAASCGGLEPVLGQVVRAAVARRALPRRPGRRLGVACAERRQAAVRRVAHRGGRRGGLRAGASRVRSVARTSMSRRPTGR